jgi:hypothetical protein
MFKHLRAFHKYFQTNLKGSKRDRNSIAKFAMGFGAGALIITSTSLLYAASKDTPQDVMKAGKNGSAEIAPMLTVIREANALMNKMGSDPKYAEAILKAANSKNQAELVALLKKEAPQSTIKVESVSDFTIVIVLQFGSHTLRVCASNESGCGGKKASASLK